MKAAKPKPSPSPSQSSAQSHDAKPPIDASAVERLLSDPAAAAQAEVGVALAAVEAARAASRPEVLWALSEHPTREIGKAARRALHLLRSRGVEVGERPGTPAVQVTAAKPEESTTEPCRTTPVDGFGDRALWIPLKRTQGFDLWELILSDERGVVEAHRVEISRKQLHAHFASLPRGGMGIYELPQARAAGFLAEAIALGGDPRALGEARQLLDRLGGGDPALAAPAAAADPALPDESARLAESPALFDEPEARTFVPTEELLRELAGKLDEIDVSPLLLDDQQKIDRRQHVLDQAVESYFTPERRTRYARRLFELSDLWNAEGRSASAARAGATARHLAGAGPILDSPFARRMFQRVFAPPPTTPAPEPEKHSQGGLILPG
jgi:hypothetical protein